MNRTEMFFSYEEKDYVCSTQTSEKYWLMQMALDEQGSGLCDIP